MARLESKQIMGFLALEEKHHEAVLSLLTPATKAHKILDPFAGEGDFLEAAAEKWNITPYANELDGDRAAKCIERFGLLQAVRSDALRLRASNHAFSAIWCNPPYDVDKGTGGKRVEFAMLRHSWKWAMTGALVFWVVYQHHISEEAATFLAKNSRQVDIWALPGKHLGQYDQIIVAAIKGLHPKPEQLYDDILAKKTKPTILSVQSEAPYQLPTPNKTGRFIFAPDLIDAERGLQLIETRGAWQSNGFQALLDIAPPPSEIEPVVAPRPGHMALVLAAGVANGAVIDTDEYGQVAIRGKTRHVEAIKRVDIENDPKDAERQIKKTIVQLKPVTTLTLLAENGTRVEMDGDEALLNFIISNKQALTDYLNTKFKPMYDFNFNGIRAFLDRVLLNGKYPLYAAQKHVIAAITRGFESRNSILLSGQMGTGKTAMGSSSAIAIAKGAVQKLQADIGADQVILIICPPHLIEKWKRELLSISSNIIIEHLKRHEDVKAFMDKAQKIGAGIPKIGLIKRDMTKLGAGHETAVVWRNQATVLWKHNEPTPAGYEEQARIIKKAIPKCPHCGAVIMQEKKGTTVVASKRWLKAGKRNCTICHSPLWQAARDRGSKPKHGHKYPTKNPRYRLDEYLKKQYPDRIYLLIWDEIHEAANGDTGNGQSFGRIAGLANKVLAMTGTPFNGRSSSLFNIEYHLNERVRQQYPWGGAQRLKPKTRGSLAFQKILEGSSKQRGRAESQWVAAMGVRERVIEERPSYNSNTGAYTGTSTYERPYTEAPGISPLLIAEVLDHTVFFSLGDLGKWLPRYEEIAYPVVIDDDILEEYKQTREYLKNYLIERRHDGDLSFRGAYLQWSMGWPNSPFRPTNVIHNLRHPITHEKQAHIVKSIPSFGEERIYAKEQALIDLLSEELANNRPCVVYIRQTATKDIQPRIEKLIREHVPNAKPYILKNTISAERREKVLTDETAKGNNILICNPELVKTGIDLIAYPSLIYYEIVFNLSTMMQASARSYRLNQTHEHCKVIYMYAEGTMEETAVHLMSRKQRAAKLLTGDIGLTGLEALTQGEGGLEAALLDALTQDNTLIDPRQMFQSASSDIDAEDADFWNIEVAAEPENEGDALLEEAITLGAVLREEQPISDSKPVEEQTTLASTPAVVGLKMNSDPVRQLQRRSHRYLAQVSIVSKDSKRIQLQAELISMMLHGVLKDDQTRKLVGLLDMDFPKYEIHSATMLKSVQIWLKNKRFVFMDCEAEVAAEILKIARQSLSFDELQLDVFQAMQDMQDKTVQTAILQDLQKPRSQPVLLPKPAKKKRKTKKMIDLMAIPEDSDEGKPKTVPLVQAEPREDDIPKQLAMF